MRAALLICPALLLWSCPVAYEMSPPETDQIFSKNKLSRNAIGRVWDPYDIKISNADDCKPSFPEPIAGRVFCYDKSAFDPTPRVREAHEFLKFIDQYQPEECLFLQPTSLLQIAVNIDAFTEHKDRKIDLLKQFDRDFADEFGWEAHIKLCAITAAQCGIVNLAQKLSKHSRINRIETQIFYDDKNSKTRAFANVYGPEGKFTSVFTVSQEGFITTSTKANTSIRRIDKLEGSRFEFEASEKSQVMLITATDAPIHLTDTKINITELDNALDKHIKYLDSENSIRLIYVQAHIKKNEFYDIVE